tara:strand:+ start:2078 stop:2971 length:894 start_codon:yes stop_codon:yes gene_type:complete
MKRKVLHCFRENIHLNKVRIIQWNNVSKRLKYWLFEKIYEKLNIKYTSDIVTYIIEEYMKPNLKHNNHIYSHINTRRFGEYIWKPNIFENRVCSNKRVRCNGCHINGRNDIIPFKRTYFSICSCDKNYCKKCFKKYFVKDNKVEEVIQCRGCRNDIHSNDIYKHRSGFSRFDLSKLYFDIYWTEYHLCIKFYDINKSYKNDKNIIYLIKLNLLDWGTIYNNVSIRDICKYILFLRWYYRKTVYTEIIIFSKFYYLVNEILEYIFVEPKSILRNNHSYKNPRKMLEVFLVLDSINKYY